MATTSGESVDLIVIGGGSGGLAGAKEAARLGAKVVVFDYVEPTTHGTKWGLGGTCVNVGCVPKKLMHYGAAMAPVLHHDAAAFGWEVPADAEHTWETLSATVTNYVRSLNFGYRTGLMKAGVKYINAFARFAEPHKVVYRTAKDKEDQFMEAKYFLIAAGGRPDVPSGVPGALELAITSDDIFWKKTAPGKTLVVGASYVALECAGFLRECGFDVTVAVRSICLRGFDQQCAEKVKTGLVEVGVKFREKQTPTAMLRQTNDQIQVAFSDGSMDQFDTVLYATGRRCSPEKICIEKAGVVAESNGKIKVVNEQTTVPHIFAVGDVLFGRPELTPVAIKAAELLARRIFGGAPQLMDYNLVPTSVFTPLEYGSIGLSEEAALEQFGEADLETYLREWTSLEMSAAHRESEEPNCLAKIICVKSQDERIVGFHFVGPNAGEVTQGFALAMRCGARKVDLDNTVGIHPTDAEALTQMEVTRRSGEDFRLSGGCGGGKCG